MALDPALLKFYRSTTWSDAAANGGAINTGAEITTATSENIFPNITDAERQSGVTKYKKVFFRNENTDAYNNVKAWIETNTPSADTAVTIVAGGSVSQQGTDVAVPTTTFTFAASVTVTASADCSKQLRPGEQIWNSTNDTATSRQTISTISADGLTITLGSAYAGTTGATKAATVRQITDATFVTAVNEGAGVVLGSLPNNASIAVWAKLVVNASSQGYTDDTFTLRFSNS